MLTDHEIELSSWGFQGGSNEVLARNPTIWSTKGPGACVASDDGIYAFANN
jgi:hypothetical protein